MRYETRAVLASRYLNTQTAKLTHSVSLDAVDFGRETAVCGRVRVDSLADRHASDVNAAPTCAQCLRRDPRFNR
jgi:hypothetical protein